MTHHHPSDDLLVDHLRGALPQPAAQVVEAHVDRCPECRRLAKTLTDVAGAALLGLDETPVARGLLADTLSKIESMAAPGGASGSAPDPTASNPTSGFRKWRWVGPGVRLAESAAPPVEGWRGFLLKVEPGRSLPAHGHEGEELTCVLQGGFTDGERSFGKGDFAEAAGSSPHTLTAAMGEPCLCILAIRAPLKWCGAARWFQPIIGL